MTTSPWAVKFLTSVRLFLCAFLVVCYVKEARFWLLIGVALSAALALPKLPTPRSHLEQFIGPALERVFCLTCFFLLILLGACPPFFLGLLITVSLVEATVSVYFQWQRLSMPHGPTRLVLRLQRAQWGWIVLVTVLTQIQFQHPASGPVFFPVEAIGYFALAVFHVYVFYVYSLRFQPYLWPELRAHSRHKKSRHF